MNIQYRILRLGLVTLIAGMVLAGILLLMPQASEAHPVPQDIEQNDSVSSAANTMHLESNAAWRTFTGPDTVYAFAFEGDFVWWGTNQGVVKWDKTSNTYVRYTTSNSGLVNNSVRAIAIDTNGTKWFGTSGGVSVLSGMTWTTYTTANSGLAGDSVRAIALDANGTRWFGTLSGGVSVLSGTTWTTYTQANTGNGLLHDSVRAIAQDASGAKWFATGGGVSVLSGTTWTTYTQASTASGLATNSVYAVAIDQDDAKWFGFDTSGSRGVSVLSGTTWTRYTTTNSGLKTNYVSAIAVDSTGAKWFGHREWFGTSSFGVSVLSGTTWTSYSADSSGLVNNDINVIAMDPNGAMWFGTAAGVSSLSGTTWASYSAANSGLAHNYIRAIALDAAGTKWFGTQGGGVSALSGTTWTTYTRANTSGSLGSNGIYAAAVDINGDKWFGTARGGVSQLSGTTWTRYTNASTGGGLTDDFVIAAAIGADGSKWFGGFSLGGVSVLSGTTWTAYTVDTSGDGWNDAIYGIAIDGNGVKWFAANGGVSVLSGTTWTTYTVDNTGGGLLDYYVNAVAIDLDGAKWFGTGNGVSVLSGTTWLTYTAANSGLVDNNVMAITIGADGTKWFGTGGGVSVLSGTTWTTYTTANSGLASNGISAIAIDVHGNKWFGTSVGVSVLFAPNASTTIAPGGGQLNWPEYGPSASLVFPTGAVTQTIDITFTRRANATSVPPSLVFAGYAFQLDAFKSGVLQSGFAFEKPVTVTLYYDDSDVAGLDENTLILSYWNGSAWASDGINVAERNAAGNYAVFTVAHLGEFALFGTAGAPIAAFTASPTSGARPLTVYFFDTSTGAISNWLWNFGDGGTSTQQSPIHIYNATGAYTVTLTVGALTTGTVSLPGNTNTLTRANYILVSAPAEFDLALAKYGPTQVIVNEPITYTLRARNQGVQTTTGVVLTDTLPAGVTFISADSGCTLQSAEAVCALGSLAPGAEKSVTLIARSTLAFSLWNTAQISANELDTNPANNTAMAHTNVLLAQPDLSVDKFTFANTVEPGSDVTYWINFNNNAPWPATQARITDTLPISVSLMSAEGWYNGITITAQVIGNRVVWTLPRIEGNTGGQLRVTGRVAEDTLSGTALVNTAQIASDEADLSLSDNSDWVTTIVQARRPDLYVVKYHTAFLAEPGSSLPYIIYYGNQSDSRAVSVRITDTLPANVSYASDQSYAVGGTWPTSTHTGNTVVWTLPALGPHQSSYIYLTGTVASSAQTGDALLNTVQIASGDTDVNPLNNTATDVITVQVATRDLGITQSTWREPEPGDVIDYSLYYWNQGNSPATNVRVTDTLPANTSYVWASYNDLAQVSGNQVIWTLPALPPYGYGYLYLQARVSNSAVNGDLLVNTARVGGDGADIDPANNVSVMTSTVRVGGHITGVVTAPDGVTLLPNIQIEVYQNISGTWMTVGWAQTDAAGRFDVGRLNSGVYRIRFYDWSRTYPDKYYDDASTLAGASDITVSAGATVSNVSSSLNPPAPPVAQAAAPTGQVTNDPATGQVQINMGRSNTGDITVTKAVACPNGISPENVTLVLSTTSSITVPYPMSLVATGVFTYWARIPSTQIQSGELKVSYTCPGLGAGTQPVGRIQLFDPSGQITDADTGQPIQDVQVSLFKLPGWRPKSSPTDVASNTCETNLTKGPTSVWMTQPAAPTQTGVQADPASGEIDPQANPLWTDQNGRYGWNVAEGCWYVVAQKAGYADRTSPAVGVPPEVTDLDLSLMPLAIPDVRFTAAAYTVTESAGQATLTVTLSLAAPQAITVSYTTSNGTAIAGSDYVTASGDLVFGLGDMTRTITVTILNDAVHEVDETFTVTLSNAVNGTLVAPTMATVTITDDDVAPPIAAGVSLTPNQNGRVYPGQSIVYQHTLTNTGVGADSFTVTASIDRPGWSVMAAPSVVGPLGPGIASSVVVTVTAPSGITTTVTATARITATSKFDANVTSAVLDVTTGHPYKVYLPVVIR